MDVRARAARVLSRLADHRGSLGEHLRPHRQAPEYGLLQEICFGVCRHHQTLDFLLGQLLERPMRERDSDLKYLLLGALYQLRELAVPDYAVIDQTVKAAGQLRKQWSKPLANAVLRNYQRRQTDLIEALERQSETVRLNHPAWLTEAIRADWPQDWRTVLERNNDRPPMSLRVNRLRTSREEAMERLQQAGLDCVAGEFAQSAIYLAEPRPVNEIPGFADGLLSVQDEASQLAPAVLGPEPGARLLDACAAPGGKTCHLLESQPGAASCLALDRNASRSEMIRQNLKRLGLEAELAVADAADLSAWWDGSGFDNILLDAPCSATGVIRRHPDIKLLLRPDDVERHGETQFSLLAALWPCLKPGGRLLYTTCSVLRRENEQVVSRFLAAAGDAKTVPITADWGIECAHGKQLLPGGANGPDGFYFCLLRKS